MRIRSFSSFVVFVTVGARKKVYENVFPARSRKFIWPAGNLSLRRQFSYYKAYKMNKYIHLIFKTFFLLHICGKRWKNYEFNFLFADCDTKIFGWSILGNLSVRFKWSLSIIIDWFDFIVLKYDRYINVIVEGG